MKNTLYLIPFFLILNYSCANGELKEENEMLEQKNNALIEESERKDSALYAFLYDLNKIEANLQNIREKEKSISIYRDDIEGSEKTAEKVITDIKAIEKLMEKNQLKIESLQRSLEAAEMDNSEMEKFIERLTGQIQEKDKQISELQQELFETNQKLKTLFSEYNERIEDLAEKEDELHTAYYAFGTYRKLREEGVLTKEGGFIGIGRTEKLQNNFNRDYFTKIDTRELRSIPLAGKNPKLVTNHPEKSFHFEGESGNKKLIIDDSEVFWSISSYLVLTID